MAKGATTLYEARRAKDGISVLPNSTGSRAMRVPFGFVLVLCTIVIALGMGVYYLGFRAGVASADLTHNEAQQGATRTIDPLLSQSARDGGGTGTPRAANPPEIAPQPRRIAPAVGDTPLGPPPIGDPRQAGLNYLIIADVLAPDRANELVGFCRGQGLDAITIPSHNARSQVIVLPGYGWEDREGDPVKALEAKIRAVGAKWKALGRGNGDFRDFYPKLFKGQ
ncbi:MAG: hypothetical protein EXS17_05485 [Phycisphaerales bacterium]|nr:hypothetical protein [Phycisphaerales bacterium]